MPPRLRRAFETVFPTVVPHLGAALLLMIVLLYPGLPWYVKLPFSLIMLLLLVYVGGRVLSEYQADLSEDAPPPADFVPLEPLDLPGRGRQDRAR